MEHIDMAISLLMKILFSFADREKIDKTVKEAIDMLIKAKKELG